MTTAAHPKPEELVAFAQGKLSAADSAAIEEHLFACDACVRSLDNQPEDALLLLARQMATHAGSTAPAPLGSETCLAAQSGPRPGPTAGGDVPALLAGRYRVLRLLGEGGMGAVYVAEHRVMRRLVALKVIKQIYTNDPTAVERFRREVRAAAQLQHPNIVAAHDADRAGDTHFLVMEYVDGVSLARLLRERGPLPVAEACAYIWQAALGLQHAHERGMVHRDIKPDNLMLAAGGTVKVVDFGLAALTAERSPDGLTEANALMGTPDYMAPEQAEDARQADTRADVYSLGCTLYHLLSGQVPYPASTGILKVLAHREKPLPSIRAVRSDVPPELAAVLGRMLAKRPADRYQTPGVAAAALAPFAAAGPCLPAGRPAPAASAGRPRRWPLLAGALLAAVLAAVAIIRIQTEQGEIVLRTDDPNLEVIVRKSGKLVRIRDTRSGQVWELNTRNYRIGLADQPGGLTIALPDREPLTLYRGDRPLLTVKRQPRPAKGPPDALRRRQPEHDPQRSLALHWGAAYRKMSARECLRRGVAALGRNEDFILAETVGDAVFGHNEKTAVVVFPIPAKDCICVCVVAAGRDITETGRLWTGLLGRICDGPSPVAVPDWLATKATNRKSQAPILRLSGDFSRLGLMRFTEAAVASVRRQGFRVEVNKERDAILGYKQDSVAAVFYDAQADGRGYISVVTGAIDGREAERLRKEIPADVFAERKSP